MPRRASVALVGDAAGTGAARRFTPHVTLARCARPADLRPAVAALAAYRGPWWTATSVELVRSTLGPQPRYEVLDAFALGARS